MEYLLSILIPVLCRVESNNDPNAVGDNGEAVGILQLHECYVDDVNRILERFMTGQDLPTVKFKYADRANRQLSIEMTKIYLIYYGHKYEQYTGRPVTHEVLARIHNGGPRGWKKSSTSPYWGKVAAELARCSDRLAADAATASE